MKVNDAIVQFMIKNEVIMEEEKELYKFGIGQGIIFLLNITTMLLIGLAMNNFGECVVMSFVYINIRKYAGGYHAKDIKVCYVLSSLLIILGLCCVNLLEFHAYLKIVAILFSTVAILRLAPHASANKPLDMTERVKYKRKVWNGLGIALVLAFIFECMGMSSLSSAVLAALFLASVMLWSGKLENLLTDIQF